MAALKFTKEGQWYISDAITPTDNDSIIVNITSRYDEVHKLVIEHSINKNYWMVCGSTSYMDGIELTVDGIRPNVQYVRFKTEVAPIKAEWV